MEKAAAHFRCLGAYGAAAVFPRAYSCSWPWPWSPKAVRPYREARGQSAQLARTQAENSAVAAQNALITRHIAYLKTNDGVASEARKMGYLRPGEIPIVVEGLTTPGSQPMPAAAPASALFPSAHATPARATQGSAAERFWRHLTGH